MPCMISIVSRTWACRRGNRCGTLAAANSSGIQPEPTPTLSRPPDRWSWVASSAASTPGERYGVSMMLMPIRTFWVFAASQGISVMPWNHLPREMTGKRVGEVGHHAERVLQLHAVGGLRDDDPVERPDGVEVELLGEGREVLELLDGHLVAEVRKVESELHAIGLLEVSSSSGPASGERRSGWQSGRALGPAALPGSQAASRQDA